MIEVIQRQPGLTLTDGMNPKKAMRALLILLEEYEPGGKLEIRKDFVGFSNYGIMFVGNSLEMKDLVRFAKTYREYANFNARLKKLTHEDIIQLVQLSFLSEFSEECNNSYPYQAFLDKFSEPPTHPMRFMHKPVQRL